MKRILVLIALSLLGFIVPKTFAETSVDIENNGDGASSDVHVENNVGQSTTCVNGKCENTQNGDNTSTVCINGKCETTQGNVDRQEGGTSVKVENSPPSNASGQSGTPTVTPTITPTPTHEASISAQKKEDSKTKQSSLEQMIDNIRKFFTELFSSNK